MAFVFFKSSTLCGWPILGRVHGAVGLPIFMIGMYVGKEKPSSFDEFLTPFCVEYDKLKLTGVSVNGIIKAISIRAFICDSPARSYVTSTHHHNHSNGCHKCLQNTTFEDYARVYSNKVGIPRTDYSFFYRHDKNTMMKSTKMYIRG